MKWMDYRDALGIGFSNNEKAKLLSNKLSVMIDILDDTERDNEEDICRAYFVEVSEIPINHYAWYEVKRSLTFDVEVRHLLSKAVALINSIKRIGARSVSKNVEKAVMKSLDDLSLSYEIRTDSDGIFIFPKGAKELDEANVNTPLEWLKKYPLARNAMEKALRAYSDSNDYSTTADLFRKALETFAQEFFKEPKSLDNLKSSFGSYCKEKGVPKELSGNIETTMQMYTNYMNNYAKHHDKTSKMFLEFIMYQTGNIIRFMISLDQD